MRATVIKYKAQILAYKQKAIGVIFSRLNKLPLLFYVQGTNTLEQKDA